jgi:cysteinyl-tRNA synthetase
VPLSLYDSRRKAVYPLVPLDPTGKRVTVYTCGPTVYGRPHIGNYTSFLMADLLCRWLEVGHGQEVIHVKNITDVGHLVRDADSGEDKIEKQAREEHGQVTEQTVFAIARGYEEQYLRDEVALGCREPQHRPRASAYVSQMVDMVEDLVQKGHAYSAPDGIYFDITSPTPTPYGSLSGNRLEVLSAGARIEVNEGKRHPADFALWKFCVGGNEHHVLRWPSPVVPGVPLDAQGQPVQGFPGWHIECSAMSRELLGDQLDVHTGGEDNIFPHHECEIAQSECCTGRAPFVGLWLHRRRMDLKGEKMSKSLGNILSLDDIVAKGFSLMDFRYAVLSVHYRTNLKFSWEALEAAKQARRSIVEWMGRQGRGEYAPVAAGNHELQDPAVSDIQAFERDFRAALDDDLNVSAALAAVFGLMHYVNTRTMPAAEVKTALASFIRLIQKTFACFDEEALVIPADVQAILDERAQARASKNFASSDALRDQLLSLGWAVKDVKIDGREEQRVSRA